MRTHGTISCYRRGGCRCDQCKKVAVDLMRRYRARRRQAAGAVPAVETLPEFPQALCAAAPEHRRNQWFADASTPTMRAAQQDAIAICQQCPEQAACRTWALNHPEEVGIWGGLTEKERRTIRHSKRQEVA